MNDEYLMNIVKEISENHSTIINDWCKAYLSQLYKEGIEIKPGNFILHQRACSDPDRCGYDYWFTLKDGL